MKAEVLICSYSSFGLKPKYLQKPKNKHYGFPLLVLRPKPDNGGMTMSLVHKVKSMNTWDELELCLHTRPLSG